MTMLSARVGVRMCRKLLRHTTSKVMCASCLQSAGLPIHLSPMNAVEASFDPIRLEN